MFKDFQFPISHRCIITTSLVHLQPLPVVPAKPSLSPLDWSSSSIWPMALPCSDSVAWLIKSTFFLFIQIVAFCTDLVHSNVGNRRNIKGFHYSLQLLQVCRFRTRVIWLYDMVWSILSHYTQYHTIPNSMYLPMIDFKEIIAGFAVTKNHQNHSTSMVFLAQIQESDLTAMMAIFESALGISVCS